MTGRAPSEVWDVTASLLPEDVTETDYLLTVPGFLGVVMDAVALALDELDAAGVHDPRSRVAEYLEPQFGWLIDEATEIARDGATCVLCGQRVDRRVCCCGETRAGHDDVDDHPFVPYGCDCMRAP